MRFVLPLLLSVVVACPAASPERPKRTAAGDEPVEGEGEEGEGEGDEGEGEGEGDEGEGEGDEGEGEGEGDAGEGEGEGEGEGDGGVVVGGSAGCGNPVDVDPDGDQDPFTYPISVTVGAREREFGVWAFDDYDPNVPKALILLYHGNTNIGQLPAGPRGRGFFDMEAEVGRDAIIVYVDAENLSQDPDFVSWETLNVTDTNPDIQAFRAIVDYMQDTYCVDVNRTFAVGFSGGANFVNGLACQHADLVRGVATYSGGFEERHGGVLDLDEECTLDPVAALSIHNVNDSIAEVEESDRAVAYYRAASACDDEGVEATDEADCSALVGCDADAPVVFCRPDEPTNGAQAHDVWKPQGPTFVWNFFDGLR